jgi:hypothetical protein
MAWEIGTDSSEKLREALRDFIKAKMTDSIYRNRLPRQHIHYLKSGETQSAGVFVIVHSGPDENAPRQYEIEGHRVLEEYHQIAVVVKADKKAGGMASVAATYGALKALFGNYSETSTLIPVGICDLSESAEGMEIDGADNDSEGEFYKRQLNLKCNTELLVS